jgi:SOS response regulatory protein OraA/RecX
MAIVVLAQLKSLESRKETPEVKFDVKFTLIRMLYRKGYKKEQIAQLLNFID